jgi:two-component system response regulator YesN
MKLIRTLIVEDEIWERKGLISMIDWDAHGMQLIAEVSNGEEALQILSSEQIDLVLTDMNMPIVDGAVFLKNVRITGYECEFVVISGYTAYEYMKQAISSSVFEYVLKPFNKEELNSVLRKVCERINSKVSERENQKAVEDMLKMSRPLIRENLLNMLLENIPDDKYENCVLELKKLDITLSLNGYYRVVVISVGKTLEYEGSMKDVISKEITDLLEMKLHNCQSKVLFKRDGINDEIIILFWDSIKRECPSNAQLREFSKSIFQAIKHDSSITVNIGIGEPEFGIDKIKETYEQALIASKFEDLRYESNPVFYINIKDIQLNTPALLSRDDRNLIKEVFSLDVSNLPWFIMEQFRRFDGEKYCNIIYLRRNIVELLVLLEECCQSINLDFKGISSTNPMDDVNHFNKVHIFRQWLESLTKNIVIKSMSKQSKTTSIDVVDQIIFYIEENYMEDIKLITLSQKYFLNHIYLSRLFRERTGKNFIDYLTDIRMQKAKELLQNKKFKVKDVSTMVGYDNPYYFSKRYKKYFIQSKTDK